MSVLVARPLTAEAFAPFGDVIDATGDPDWLINEDRCGRHHDRARLDFADGRAGISVFDSRTVTLPCPLAMVERHPLGSQAFLPIGAATCLIVVAEDEDDHPVRLRAFRSRPGQGFNILRNVWHGVLAPLDEGRFFVIDRIGEGTNLEIHDFTPPILIESL